MKMLAHMPIDRERTPWSWGEKRFANPDDLELNMTPMERFKMRVSFIPWRGVDIRHCA